MDLWPISKDYFSPTKNGLSKGRHRYIGQEPDIGQRRARNV